MCTVIVFQEAGVPFPTIVAANRDERADRPTRGFGRHWPDKPWQAGLDEEAGGTWSGLHDNGFGVYLLNQPHSLGPEPGRRSRGQLVLDLLDAGSVDAASARVAGAGGDVRPCHVILASASLVRAYSHTPAGFVEQEVRPGATIWTASGADDPADARVAAHKNSVNAINDAWRESGDIRATLSGIEGLLASGAPQGASPYAALSIEPDDTGFGTRSSSIVAYPRMGSGRPILGRVCDGSPAHSRFRKLTIQPG